MKKLIVLAFIAFAAVQSFAVGLGLRESIIVGGGTGDDHVWGGAAGSEYFGVGDAFTFEMYFPITSTFGIHPAAGFEYGMYSYEEDGYDATTYSYIYLDLTLPVMARFYIIPGLFAEAGFNFGLNMVSAILADYDDDSSAETIDEANPLNIELAVGAGYVFPFGLSLDMRFCYGLTDVLDVKNFKGDNVDFGRFGVHIGLSYWFKRPFMR